MSISQRKTITQIYELLWKAYGPQSWWPADSPTEVVIGAILTQNTAWKNVERAISNLKSQIFNSSILESQIRNSKILKSSNLKSEILKSSDEKSPGSKASEQRLPKRQLDKQEPQNRKSPARRSLNRLSARQSNLLDWQALRDIDEAELAELIRPAGTFRIKARRLKTFVEFLWTHHDGSLEALLSGELDEVRARLLSIPGIGPETADAILLYAGARPSFVVDAYTMRILRRHFVIDAKTKYAQVRDIFHKSLPPDVQVFNEYHALLVEVGKRHCRAVARCEGCPLESLSHDATM